MWIIEKSEQPEPLEEGVAIRAYERWVQRGRPIGDGLEDWFVARAEIEAGLARKQHDLEVAIYDG